MDQGPIVLGAGHTHNKKMVPIGKSLQHRFIGVEFTLFLQTLTKALIAPWESEEMEVWSKGTTPLATFPTAHIHSEPKGEENGALRRPQGRRETNSIPWDQTANNKATPKLPHSRFPPFTAAEKPGDVVISDGDETLSIPTVTQEDVKQQLPEDKHF
ncbi:unnamed protein product [Caretta caretta]